MNILFYYGPEKTPFYLLKNGRVESHSTVPFHGIISRGLLRKFINQSIDIELWYSNAHRLFDKTIIEPNTSLKELRAYASDSKVLSFDNSALVVKNFVLAFCKNDKNKIETSECWNIKEGHTSSVWKVTLRYKDGSNSFVLNVARDAEAGKELKLSSEKLKLVAEKIPELNCAKVYDILTIEDKILSKPVVVTRNEWVENSFEIHTRKEAISQAQEFLLIERFLTNPDKPSQITSILGRVFSNKETKKIKKEINDFIKKATSTLKQQIQISINDGDVVWNGEKAIIVAIN